MLLLLAGTATPKPPAAACMDPRAQTIAANCSSTHTHTQPSGVYIYNSPRAQLTNVIQDAQRASRTPCARRPPKCRLPGRRRRRRGASSLAVLGRSLVCIRALRRADPGWLLWVSMQPLITRRRSLRERASFAVSVYMITARDTCLL